MNTAIRPLAARLAIGASLLVGVLAVSGLTPAAASAPPPANCATTNKQLPANDGSNLAPGCFSLSVSPARISLAANAPKKAYNQIFQVTNNGNTDYRVDVFAIDYTQDLSGSLIQTKSSEDASWVTLTPTVVNLAGAFDKPSASKTTEYIAAHATQKVNIKIRPNPQATPGDHQIAIIFRKPADANASNIKVASQIGAQVLIQVPGKVSYGLGLDNGGLDTKSHGFLGLKGSTGELDTDVLNKGNIHSDFFSAQNITATTSGFGASDSAVAFPQFTVLRESAHRVSNVLIPKASSWYGCWRCKVKVSANITSPATLVSPSQSPTVKWAAVPTATSYNVVRNGVMIAKVDKGQTSFTDPSPITSGGGIAYSVNAVVSSASQSIAYSVIPWPLIIAAIIVLIVLIALIVLLVIGRKRRKARNASAAESERERIRAEAREEALREHTGTSTESPNGTVGGAATSTALTGGVATLPREGADDRAEPEDGNDDGVGGEGGGRHGAKP